MTLAYGVCDQWSLLIHKKIEEGVVILWPGFAFKLELVCHFLHWRNKVSGQYHWSSINEWKRFSSFKIIAAAVVNIFQSLDIFITNGLSSETQASKIDRNSDKTIIVFNNVFQCMAFFSSGNKAPKKSIFLQFSSLNEFNF